MEKTPRMYVRSVRETDYAVIMNLYTEFTSEEYTIGKEQFAAFVDSLHKHHMIYVIENLEGIPIGCATLLIEKKLIHNLSKVGHIEDVIISSEFRGQGYGKLLLQALLATAHDEGCYKVILDCKDEVRPFYESCGLVEKGVQMSVTFT